MAHAKPRRREGGVWWGWAMQRPLVVGGVFLLSSLFKTSRLRANKSATVLKPGAFPSITIYLMNKPTPDIESLATQVVDAAYRLHRDLGPGLLESVYEVILAKMLTDLGLRVVRQVTVPIEYAGVRLDDGFRADLIVENLLIVELKSVERASPVHAKQLLTYLRLQNRSLGFLINFGAATFKEGIKRVVNHHTPPGPLHIHNPV